MVKFFVDYMSQDSIGMISNAHLALSDRLGIFSPVCGRIAAKNAVAVDFPKTGKPARPLNKAERAHVRPDFMMVVLFRHHLTFILAGVRATWLHVAAPAGARAPSVELRQAPAAPGPRRVRRVDERRRRPARRLDDGDRRRQGARYGHPPARQVQFACAEADRHVRHRGRGAAGQRTTVRGAQPYERA